MRVANPKLCLLGVNFKIDDGGQENQGYLVSNYKKKNRGKSRSTSRSKHKKWYECRKIELFIREFYKKKKKKNKKV